jgi:hypothetical protein
MLCPATHAKAGGIPQEYDYGYQVYQEDDDRIRVESHYVRGKWNLLEGTSFRMQYLNDAISGASPTGALPGGTQPYVANVEDVRTGILGALSQQVGNHKLELEVSQSNENDYFSNGYALSDAIELNQKNTTLTLGVNILDDTVTVPALGDRGKESYDFFTGISQLLDKDTEISGSLTLGFSKGYMNDPYKVVQRDEVFRTPDTSIDAGDGTFLLIPGVDVPVTNIYRENRPDSRFRQVLQIGGKHYFAAEKAALEAALRYTHDDYGISSEMVQVEWRQEVGEHLEIVPFVRYYHQNAADFFVNDLNQVNVATPADDPDGSGPNYSADYRLSSFDTNSIGVRILGKLSENLTLSATYERYTMKGVGEDTSPSGSYPSANMLTVGLHLQF